MQMVNIKSAPPTLPFDTPVTGMGGGRMRDAVHYFKIKQGKKIKILIKNGNKGIFTSQQSKTPEWTSKHTELFAVNSVRFCMII